jgi:peptide/nickel transport system substrate-binding protein
MPGVVFRIGLIGSIVALGLGAAGCGSGKGKGNSSSGPKRGGKITFAISFETASLDPANCGAASFDRCAPIFGTLLRYDMTAKKLVGQMADSFTSDNAKVWTLKLRPEVKFSDGQPFDADAVVFNWDRIKDPKTLSPAASLTQGMSWKAVDPATVQVTLDKPNYQLPWALTKGLGAIGSPKGIQAAGADVDTKPVGAGPFVLKSWVPGTQIIYTRNANYFEKGLPNVDQLEIKIIGSNDQRLNSLRTGELNANWSLVAKDATTMTQQGGFDSYEVPMIGGTGLTTNLADPVMKDEGLRQAMLHTFDAKQIDDAVYPGEGVVDALLSPDSPYRNDSLGMNPKKDIGEAKRLFDDYLSRTGKSSATVTFIYAAGIPALEQVSSLIQQQVQQIKGLTLEPVDAPVHNRRLVGGDYQTALAGPQAFEPDSIYQMYHTGGSFNWSNYSNPEVDQALDTTRTSNDEAAVKEAYEFVNGQVSKDGPVRTYRYLNGYLITNSHIKGVALAPTNTGAGAYWQYAWIDN